MKIKSLTYTRTKQIRQYEPAVISVTIEIEEGDDLTKQMQFLRDWAEIELAKVPR